MDVEKQKAEGELPKIPNKKPKTCIFPPRKLPKCYPYSSFK